MENMEDFSNDLFSSFFDDPVLDEKSPLLDMELDAPAPGIQAEHSYSLSGDSAPQSPLVPIKMEDTTQGKMCKGPGVRKLGGRARRGLYRLRLPGHLPTKPFQQGATPGLLVSPEIKTIWPLLKGCALTSVNKQFTRSGP